MRVYAWVAIMLTERRPDTNLSSQVVNAVNMLGCGGVIRAAEDLATSRCTALMTLV